MHEDKYVKELAYLRSFWEMRNAKWEEKLTKHEIRKLCEVTSIIKSRKKFNPEDNQKDIHELKILLESRNNKSCLRQWWACSFEINKIRYQSAEQYMMTEKVIS